MLWFFTASSFYGLNVRIFTSLHITRLIETDLTRRNISINSILLNLEKSIPLVVYEFLERSYDNQQKSTNIKWMAS